MARTTMKKTAKAKKKTKKEELEEQAKMLKRLPRSGVRNPHALARVIIMGDKDLRRKDAEIRQEAMEKIFELAFKMKSSDLASPGSGSPLFKKSMARLVKKRRNA
jgi:hypothetical protein